MLCFIDLLIYLLWSSYLFVLTAQVCHAASNHAHHLAPAKRVLSPNLVFFSPAVWGDAHIVRF